MCTLAAPLTGGVDARLPTCGRGHEVTVNHRLGYIEGKRLVAVVIKWRPDSEVLGLGTAVVI